MEKVPAMESSPSKNEVSAIRSPAKDVSPSSALDMLREGVEQVVEIPWRYMLVKIMEGLKSPKMPVFRCTKKSDCCYQGSVNLDVSTKTVTVEPENL